MYDDPTPVETTVAHSKKNMHEWSIAIHDDPMRFEEWKDAFDAAADLIQSYPFGATETTVRYIDPDLLVIRVVIKEVF